MLLTGSRTPVRLSIPECDAVFSRVGSADENAALAIDPDRLAPPKGKIGDLDLMSATREFGDDWLGIPGLHSQNPAGVREAARRFRSLLRVHSAIEHAVEKMGLPNCLIMAAHYAKMHDLPYTAYRE